MHGDGRAPTSHAVQREPGRFVCLQPPCERYGTHHSKAIFVLRPHSLSVHVTTANFIKTDLENKTNGVWSGTFPAKSLPSSQAVDGAAPVSASFGDDLLAYLTALKSCGVSPAAEWNPRMPQAWVTFDPSWVSRYAFDGCNARLIGSIPGRHTGRELMLSLIHI